MPRTRPATPLTLDQLATPKQLDDLRYALKYADTFPLHLYELEAAVRLAHLSSTDPADLIAVLGCADPGCLPVFKGRVFTGSKVILRVWRKLRDQHPEQYAEYNASVRAARQAERTSRAALSFKEVTARNAARKAELLAELGPPPPLREVTAIRLAP